MRKNLFLTIPAFVAFLISLYFNALAQHLNNTSINGYRGIWFELNQKFEYGDKYSGGLGTYTAKHIPLAVYAREVDKTFFVFGGTTAENEKHLLCMIGYYDHKRNVVPKPTVVYDKQDVEDPHDNPVLLIDGNGFIWVFVSGRGRSRPGFKFRSTEPYAIDKFLQVTEEEMTYPQPEFVNGKGYFHFFTKYTGIRELYFESSGNGRQWTEDQKLAGIRETGDELGGHYQVSNQYDGKLATFFNRHPNGNVDKRTDLYYLQTTDFGKTWTTVDERQLAIPLSDVDSPARIMDYQSLGKNVYLKDINFDKKGNPICLYVISNGHEPGPENGPREWCITYWTGEKWDTTIICVSDHNYDMGSLYIQGNTWQLIAPVIDGPQKWGTGGEIAFYGSGNGGKIWDMTEQVTSDSRYNHSYMRRPVDAKDPFFYFWADGDPDSLSISRLYFGDSKGRVWRLPYVMQSEYECPEKVKKNR